MSDAENSTSGYGIRQAHDEYLRSDVPEREMRAREENRERQMEERGDRDREDENQERREKNKKKRSRAKNKNDTHPSSPKSSEIKKELKRWDKIFFVIFFVFNFLQSLFGSDYEWVRVLIAVSSLIYGLSWFAFGETLEDGNWRGADIDDTISRRKSLYYPLFLSVLVFMVITIVSLALSFNKSCSNKIIYQKTIFENSCNVTNFKNISIYNN
jgi:hypothetical protein